MDSQLRVSHILQNTSSQHKRNQLITPKMMSTNAIVVAILVATVAVAQSKECAKICTLEYNPICASNGGEFRLFGNPCFYEAYECETDTGKVLLKLYQSEYI